MVSEVIKCIEAKFGKMTVTRDDDHDFLGMNVRYRRDGTFSILMKDYLVESITEFGEELVSTTKTPAQKYLFSVNKDRKLLDIDRAKRFHSITAKLLYVSNRTRVDIKFSIAFITTRVSKSTEQDAVDEEAEDQQRYCAITVML